VVFGFFGVEEISNSGAHSTEINAQILRVIFMGRQF
jgi:hypothetical protein